MSTDSHSITRWLHRLRDDPQAARVLWERFFERLLAVARPRLGKTRRAADEEDVVVVAFERFLAGVRQGRFPRLNDRGDLWAILFTLTERQAIRQVRDEQRLKRGGARPEAPLMELPDDAPTPLEAMALRDGLERLLAALPDEELRQIALAKMEGESNADIAQRINRAEVTVERRLRLIRETWGQMDDGSADQAGMSE